ncbi:serine hydrolase [Virgibacillus sp. SK37]|uniref:serine hydrolase domain-containing protein n=1 Tax=Virgibacillus sp. SK37 TaxID=403957 RepID=UPI0004D0F519|nr:serine hydrolase domain-containing protein [Virgibacillus sp. SK37]AIF45290.1 hypothetical protein X953_06605 [Virgibacillus sp. SK37]
MEIKQQKIQKVFERFVKNKQIHETVLFVENTNGDFSYSNGYEGKGRDTPFLMASITKLFTTTCIFILKEQGKLSLDDKITKYFQGDTLNKLHIYKGKEYSMKLTVSNLLFQTSGLPDDFEEGNNNTKKRVIHQDKQYNFDDIIMLTKKHKPHFAPNLDNRAHYASVNFDLLGKIIEIITNSNLADVYEQFIFAPLELKNTYLPKSGESFVPTIYYKNSILHRPKFVESCGASGGAISTTSELMIFIKAFFGGKLFNKTVFHELEVNNKLQFAMFPIHYGAGFMRVPLSGFSTLFMGKGELIGHSGSTGSFAFYYPREDLFFVGDVNQIANSSLPVRFAMRLAMA